MYTDLKARRRNLYSILYSAGSQWRVWRTGDNYVIRLRSSTDKPCSVSYLVFWAQSVVLNLLVSWCFEPSQPQRITSGLCCFEVSEVCEWNAWENQPVECCRNRFCTGQKQKSWEQVTGSDGCRTDSMQFKIAEWHVREACCWKESVWSRVTPELRTVVEWWTGVPFRSPEKWTDRRLWLWAQWEATPSYQDSFDVYCQLYLHAWTSDMHN